MALILALASCSGPGAEPDSTGSSATQTGDATSETGAQTQGMSTTGGTGPGQSTGSGEVGPSPTTTGATGTTSTSVGTSGDDTAAETGPPADGGGSLRFFGNGGLYDDRVLIPVDDPQTVAAGPAVDVGAEDFTIELWIAPEPGGNPNPAISCGATNDWVTTNIIVDRDRHSQPPSYGLGIGGGVLVWAVQGEAGDPWSMCGTTDVLDGQWHHVAAQRRRSDGHLWLWVDGNLDAEVDGPDGDVSYPDDGVPMDVCPGGLCDYSDPFLAIGAEKHGYGEISYDGRVDELRVSTMLRYAEPFAVPDGPFGTDASTAALYHFDDGGGEVATDASGQQSDGQLLVGGDPAGPQWSDTNPWE